MKSQEQCDRMKKLCIDNNLLIWSDRVSFVFDTEYGNEFYYSIDPNQEGIVYGYVVLFMSDKKEVTEEIFIQLLNTNK